MSMLSSFSFSLSWMLFSRSLYLEICSVLFFPLLPFFSSARGWAGFSAERTFKTTKHFKDRQTFKFTYTRTCLKGCWCCCSFPYDRCDLVITNLPSVSLPLLPPLLPHWRRPGKPWSPCPTARPYWISGREPWPGRDPFHPTSGQPDDRQQTDVNVHRDQPLRSCVVFGVTDLGCGGARRCEEFGLVGTIIHIRRPVLRLLVKRHVIRDEPAKRPQPTTWTNDNWEIYFFKYSSAKKCNQICILDGFSFKNHLFHFQPKFWSNVSGDGRDSPQVDGRAAALVLKAVTLLVNLCSRFDRVTLQHGVVIPQTLELIVTHFLSVDPESTWKTLGWNYWLKVP